MVLSHRIFITRDNSTGFTIQWGGNTTFEGWINFPRGFSTIYALSVYQIVGSNVGHADYYLTRAFGVNGSGFSTYSRSNGSMLYFMALGFS